MNLISREKNCRPSNEAILRGITERTFNNGKADTSRSDPILQLEQQRVHINELLQEAQRHIANLEIQMVQDVEDEYQAIRKNDKRDIRLEKFSNAQKRTAEATRRLGVHDSYQKLCANRDQLIADLAKIRIEIEFQQREFYRSLIEVL